MWKSIKKFFKWIADHTGISWILEKFGWKNHQSTYQEQEESFDFLDELKSPAKSKNAFLKAVDNKIKLVTSADNYEALQKHFQNKEKDGTVIGDEFYLNIIKDDKQLYITGCYDSKVIVESGNIRLSINSAGTLDGKEVYGDNEPEKMKGLLDLSNKMYITINPNAPKVSANDDVPNSETTSPEAEQQIAANGQSVSA